METSISHRAEELNALMRDRLGVKLGDGFEARLAKAGRRLPRWARRDGRVIAEALGMETHPKLAQQIDRARVDKALKNLRYFLMRQNPRLRVRNRVLDIITGIAFALFVTGALVLTVLVWRGLV
ncbi:hypothetical protein [Celeribacter indicus]|uniref:Transmembrane protein n=1 Tax=Celeribacter indicus TaxID=1208324 RepID=A0A0B5DZG6_9RHOB|nr:hypothetical protein [Celeribacter indicus]AJE45592.1 hypothetical protein P73_0877 [Celeribacter indicus]SDW85117.1 hypothetical protein SAMN05443573_10858 [Celeribacter indicus]